MHEADNLHPLWLAISPDCLRCLQQVLNLRQTRLRCTSKTINRQI